MWMEEQIATTGMEMEGMAILDDSKTAVCQSFTNQNARFYVVGVKEENNPKMHWFPISTLESYLDMQRNGGKDRRCA